MTLFDTSVKALNGTPADLHEHQDKAALIVNVANGAEVAAAVWTYAHGTQGVILARDPNLARQHPADYVKGAEITIKEALANAKKSIKGFKTDQVIGIGVDTTGSTPLPVDANKRS